jgi:aspartyl-tRNA(Asn)/glutamyl-tRNA(Gln) amidotransferase subunit C
MNTSDIQKLAGLARLAVSDEEAGALTNDMNKILEYIKIIEGANIEQGERAIPVVSNVIREDDVVFSDTNVTNLIKQNFPKSKNGYLEVNKIINND